MSKTEETPQVYAAISHPLRRRILDIISESGCVGFKDLKSALNISVGALYYHLDMLRPLIMQDKDRKYFLTDQGKLALKLLASGEAQKLSALTAGRERRGVGGYVKEVFLPSRLFAYISSYPLKLMLGTLIILAFGAWISAQSNLESIMFFYNQTAKDSTVIMLSFVFSWLAIFALSDLIATVGFRRGGGDLSLLVGVSFALLPLTLFPLLVWVSKLFYLAFLMGWTGYVLLFLFQAWSLCWLSVTLSLSKGFRIDKAALVSLIVVYVNIGYIVLFGLRF